MEEMGIAWQTRHVTEGIIVPSSSKSLAANKGHRRSGGVKESNNTQHDMAPDFALRDYRGEQVRLSDYRGYKHVVLVFNRGFV